MTAAGGSGTGRPPAIRYPEGLSGTKPRTPTRVKPSKVTAKPKRGTGTTRFNASALADAGMKVRKAFRTFDEQHHLFVQEFREWFRSKGIEIDNYTVTLTWGQHSAVHSTGWNPTWSAWINANRGASPQAVRQMMDSMRKLFGLEGNPIHPYRL